LRHHEIVERCGMSRQLRLFVNALEQQLIASPQSTSLGSIRPIITGEKLIVDVVPIKRVEAGSVFWELDRSYKDDSFRIGAGVVNTPPELGDFKVTYGASTSAALSFDATADDWSTALNAMADVTSDGGVTVSGNYERGYRISWVTAGAKSDFGSDEVNLIPESSVSFSMEKEGATGIKEVVVARMQRSPAGLVTSVIPIPAGAATVSVRATGNKATREIVEITCVGDTAAIAQVEEATCVAVGGVKHVASITTVADVSDSLDGKYFVLYDDEGSVAFWIDTDNSGTTIPGGAAVYDRFVEITTINTNDSDGAVAQKVKAAVDADLKFSATVLGAVVTVTYSTVGAHGAAAAGSSGFTPATVTSGASTDNYDGTYFYLYAASTGAIVGFWFSQDGDTPPPAGALALTSDLTLITGYEPDATAMDMATLIASSIHAKTPFTTVASGTEVHVTQNTAGAVADLNAGDSPLTGATVVVNGADSTLNGKHLLLWETDGAGGEISRSVWFNISGTAAPSGTALTATQSTEILSIVTGDNAVDVAAALATKLDSLAGYRATAHGTKVRVESSVAYNFTDWSAETSGFTFTKTQNGAGGTDANAVVEVKFSEDCIGGVYSLGVDTGGGYITSEGIPWSATALEVTGILEKLSNVGTGNVIVEGAGGGDLRLSFREDLANTAIMVTVDDSALVWLEGVRATINFATTSAEALLYGLNTLDAIFEVEALAQDGVSYRTKLLHEPVVLKNGLLGISTLAPLPLSDYYDATTVDGLIIHHLKAITSLTGGTSSDLDSVVTVDITPKRAVFIYDGDNERYAVYVLEAGTDAESAPLVIRPDDYDGSTNAKVWKLMRTPTESSFSEKTIATGSITVTSSFHSVDTEANAASDDLDAVSGGASWKVAYLRANNAARAVVIKHGTGNIKCWGDTDITLDSLSKYALFVWDDENSVWLALSGTTGGGGGGPSAYCYIAYASDGSGTGFTTTFDAGLDYIAVLSTDTEILSPSAGDFSGLWKNYKGATGATGATGTGAAGADGNFVNQYQGAYVGGTSYVIGDIVTYGGGSYVCTANDPSSSVDPATGTANWDVIAEKGATGAAGSSGGVSGSATKTGSTYTLNSAEANKNVLFSNSSGCTITVGANAATDFDQWFLLHRGTSGQVTLSASGSTIVGPISTGAPGDTLLLVQVNASVYHSFLLPGGNISTLTADSSPDLAADYVRSYDASAGIEKKVLLSKIGGGLYSAMAVIEDQKSNGTDGGTFTSGAWRTRNLNTEVSDAAGIVSIASNQFTLSAGTYLIYAEAPGFYVNRHKAAIYNVTDSSYAAYGQSCYCSGVPAASTNATVSVVLTIGGTKAFELRHRCETTNATTGFGPASSFGVIEVYSRVVIHKFT